MISHNDLLIISCTQKFVKTFFQVFSAFLIAPSVQINLAYNLLWQFIDRGKYLNYNAKAKIAIAVLPDEKLPAFLKIKFFLQFN